MNNTIKTIDDIKSNRYVSLKFNGCGVPFDTEEMALYAKSRDGSMTPVKYTGFFAEENNGCAENSQFYGKIMADGHIFNPYLHRRFIAAQFMRNLRASGTMYIKPHTKKTYDWRYIMRFVKDESEKLAYLKEHDLEAFIERSEFFPVPTMKSIVKDYISALKTSITTAPKHRHRNYEGKLLTYRHIYRVGRLTLNETAEYIAQLGRFENVIMNTLTYKDICEVLKNWKGYIVSIPDSIPTSDVFVDAFVASGAFYTMKNQIMTDGKGDEERRICREMQLIKSGRVQWVINSIAL